MKIVRPKSKQPLPKNAKLVFKGRVFDVYQWRQKMFDGSYEVFEKLKRPETVLVIPVTKEGKIVLTKQKQPGKESFLGVAGGRVDEGERILQAAKRELLEETGYKSNKFILLDSVQPVSKIEWAVYTFIARDCIRAADLKPDSGEIISLKYITFDEFLEIITDFRFQDSEIPWRLVKEGFLTLKKNPKKIKLLRKMFVG